MKYKKWDARKSASHFFCNQILQKKTIDSISETHKKSEFPIKNRHIFISLP